MKWRALKTVFASVVFSVLLTPVFSQNYYLVIGAFATENDDIKEFTSYLPGNALDTAYTMYTNNSMLHLYVMKTSNKEMAQAKSMELQRKIEGKDEKLLTALDGYTLTVPDNVSGPMRAENVSSGANASAAMVPAAGAAPLKPKGQYFKFTISKDNGEALGGQVHYVDMMNGKELESFATDTYIDVLRPVKSEQTAVVCGVFGYKQVEKYINYSSPAETEGAYRDEQGAWVIPYKLERLAKGDVSVMYNVSFYKDAVVMLPPSSNDLNELVTLMKSNPNYVVKVHAHCNGKNSRKIIALGTDNNYFDVNGSQEIKGNAKQLTNLRGEAVRSYLKDHGIDENRVKIYGWGGTEMLVDENHEHAKLNDRIEIEILKD
jgi:outer membrane protein OmpA-like peptidoglycan-associated protein